MWPRFWRQSLKTVNHKGTCLRAMMIHRTSACLQPLNSSIVWMITGVAIGGWRLDQSMSQKNLLFCWRSLKWTTLVVCRASHTCVCSWRTKSLRWSTHENQLPAAYAGDLDLSALICTLRLSWMMEIEVVEEPLATEDNELGPPVQDREQKIENLREPVVRISSDCMDCGSHFKDSQEWWNVKFTTVVNTDTSANTFSTSE